MRSALNQNMLIYLGSDQYAIPPVMKLETRAIVSTSQTALVLWDQRYPKFYLDKKEINFVTLTT